MSFNNSGDLKSKKRIRVACDTCRRKKIKCDGQYPCGNCQQSNASGCIYKERKEKRTKPSNITKIPKRISNVKTIEILDTRLSKLESVILNLTNKLDPNGKIQNEKLNSILENKDRRRKGDGGTDDGDLSSIEYSDEDYDLEQEEEADYENAQNGNQKHEHRSEDNEDKCEKWDYNPQHLEHFFGTHSVICIFSDKSLGWIESALGPENSRLINPIRNLPFVFYMKAKSFIVKWVDPPLIDVTKKKKLLETPFPKDHCLVFDFLDSYYDSYAVAKIASNTDWVKNLFETYYGINGKKSRKFKCSELLIMSMAICLCISSKIDEERSSLKMSPASSCSANTSASIQSMNNDQLTMLQDELFDNCIFYYQRILVISDGIETIQAIILLIIYIESNYITSHVSYMLISVAIRFAQEIGLHRRESYTNLSAQESETRKMVWWCCYCFDMEICFRSGKPPLINGLDINVNSEMDSVFGNTVENERANFIDGEKFEVLDLRKHVSSYMQYYFLLLTKIRSKSYNNLFVASAQTESFENLLLTLESLNMEILRLADTMDPKMRPRFYNDPEFNEVYRKFDSIEMKNILIVNFVYFSNLMIINRIPFLIGIPSGDETNEKGLSFRSLYLKSARTILVIANNIPCEDMGLSFFNWAVFFPSSAFMSLLAACINHPTAPGTYDDIMLLIESSMTFFSSKRSWPVEGFNRFKVYHSKNALVDLIARILLQIVIRVFETKTGVLILENNDLLREHLERTEKQFPDIFKENKDFCSQFTSILNGSFGNQGFFKIAGNPSFASYKSSNKSTSPTSSSHQDSSFSLENDRIRLNQSQSLESNMSPNLFQASHLYNFSTNDNLMNDELLSEYMNDGGYSSIMNTQMNNLPNFFFDNNLGL